MPLTNLAVPRLTTSEAFDQVLTDARSKETRAIQSGKRPMWLYLRKIEDQLVAIGWRVEVGARASGMTRDEYLAIVITERFEEADRWVRRAASHSSMDNLEVAVYSDALAVYLTRVMRLTGAKLRGRPLGWLRAQQRWTVDGQSLERKEAQYG